ncbi:lipopolysaccharide assembly protein LapA domain-containing protein [Nocardia sp. NBC_00508]|uniref:LapA family protein n=1 Tax=Nocardia sp. NBC_00508 TaxID=2975992 RepID=UPI002E81B027|nr:lipopolysaccharide assembly protein LapA domain-containing protein [Nocardia sp. NBC_00508]WUD65009.1 lipopolysaccharide assembly protein LapA domain-containing protein [Nocardia sp. NBC_00508]
MPTHPDHTPEPDPDLAHPRTEPPGSTPPATVEKPLASRTGYAWTGLVVGVLILVVLLIFILQNLDQVDVHLFFWNFSLPLGVTVLLSVIGGALVMASVGGVRILQLRRRAKHR